MTFSAGAALVDRYQIQDHGQPRVFEVAKDELHMISPTQKHSTQMIEAQPTIEAMLQQAEALHQSTGNEVELVLYEVGVAHNEFSRRILTKQVLVEVPAFLNAQALARNFGAVSATPAPAGTNYFIFETGETGGALSLAENLRAVAGISAEPLLAKQQQKRFVPNDPLFANQWHLRNTGQSGGTPSVDVNITNVWDTYQGTGIRIAIVDDGLQHTHPDLQPNYDPTTSTNINDHVADPSPDVSFDYHGTSCAGVAAARGSNSLGVSGAAFQATLAGIRLIGGPATDAEEAIGMSRNNNLIHIKSNSWGPADDGQTLDGPGALTTAALAQGAQNGRGGRGTIYVWAAGNGLGANDNANYDGYVNSIYTIAIAALSDQGNQASYSEPGACLVVTAPSSSSGRQGITTTDLTGEDGYNYTGAFGETTDKNYTQLFGGTSSATPLSAGVIALLLQANPNLGWRDVQEILMRSATKVNPADADWATNAAGFNFNHKFGAGLINARAAINLATNWVNLSGQSNVFSAQPGLSVVIPDNNAAGITQSFDLSASNLRVEHVTVTVSITHTFRGDLAVTLTSPSGTQSRLAERHSDSGNNYASWKFMSVRHWGENSQGIWTVKIADLAGSDVGTLTSIRLDVFGTTGLPTAASADLAVTMSALPEPVAAGEELTYSLTIQNNGPTNATAVTLTNFLPAGVTFVSAVPSQGTATNNGSLVICDLGDLATNETASVTITVVPTLVGNITNTASVAAAEPDSNGGNNTASAVSTVIPQIVNVVIAPRVSGAIITWDTLTNTTGQIEYGFTTNYGFLSPLSVTPATNHAVLLVGLVTDANYFFRIIAQVGTNIVRSGPFTFSTPANLIVDNPQAQYSGLWTLGSSASDKYGTYYQSSATTTSPTPSAQANYVPRIVVPGKYDVYIWYPAGFNRTTNAPVTIFYSGGVVSRKIDQTSNGGSWQLLSAGLDFVAGTEGFATIANNAGQSGKIVMADAMRWSYPLSQDNPGDGTVPSWWSGFYFGDSVDAGLDPDGDGFSTYAEYIVGTDPTNAASRLEVRVEPTVAGFNIAFSPWQNGRVYQLVTTTNLSSGPWNFLPVAPLGGTNEGVFVITNKPSGERRFYRLAVQLAQ